MRSEAPFLLLCVPPLLLVVVLNLGGLSLNDSIKATLWVGVASLGLWGGIAGRRSGLTGWRIALGVLAGLVVGSVVLILQVILQPGKVVSGSVALG